MALVLGLLVAGVLGSEPLRAAPTTEAQHAALVKRSIARQGTAGRDVERQRLVAARYQLDARSVSAHGPLHRPLAAQAVAGNSAARRSIASGSAAHEHAAGAPRVTKQRP